MILNDSKWLQEPDPLSVLQELADKALSHSDRLWLKKVVDHHGERLKAGSSLALFARRRKLSFYPDYELIEIELALDSLVLEQFYQKALLYALLSSDEARLLTGASNVIHDLNAVTRPALPDAVAAKNVISPTAAADATKTTSTDTVNTANAATAVASSTNTSTKAIVIGSDRQACDYLKFFCSFVVAEYGPFLIVEDTQDFAWGGGVLPDNATTDTFMELVERNRDRFGWRPAPLPLRRKDVEQFVASNGDARTLFAARAVKNNAIQKASSAAEDLAPLIDPLTVASRDAQPGAVASWEIVATVWYAGFLFNARFKFSADGLVDMTDDTPLGAVTLPYWEMARDMPVLARRLPRRTVDAKTIRTMFGVRSAAGDIDAFSSGAVADEIHLSAIHRFANLRVTGTLDLSGLDVANGVEFDDVEIDGDLNLENASLGKCFTLKKVNISGCLRADGLRCRDFKTFALHVSGWYDRSFKSQEEEDETAGLQLRSAQIDGDLILESAEIYGGADLARLSCSGSAELSGISCQPRQYAALSVGNGKSNHIGLRLDRAQFNGDLRISTPIPANTLLDTKAKDPALIVGQLSLVDAVVNGTLNLSGLQTQARCSCVELSADQLADNDFLTRIENAEQNSSLDFRVVYDVLLGKVLFVLPTGSGGDVRLGSARIGGDLLMRLGGSNQRAKIDGSLIGHHLIVKRNLDLCGVRIGQSVDGSDTYRTGNINLFKAEIGDLLLSAGTVKKAGKRTVWPMEIHGYLHISEATILSDIIITGIFVAGSMHLKRAQISGELQISGGAGLPSEIGGNLSGAHLVAGKGLTLSGVRIARADNSIGVDLSAARLASFTCGPVASEDDAGKSISLRSEIYQDINLTSALIDADIFFSGVGVRGNIYTDRSKSERLIMRCAAQWRSEIDGNVSLEAASIRTGLYVVGALIHGRLSAGAAEIGTIEIYPDILERPDGEKESVRPEIAQGIDLDTARVAGSISLYGLSTLRIKADRIQVANKLSMREGRTGIVGAEVWVGCKVGTEQSSDMYAIDLANTVIGGGVWFEHAEIYGSTNLVYAHIQGFNASAITPLRRTVIHGGLYCGGIEVDTDMRLGGAIIHGPLRLTAAKIGGMLDCDATNDCRTEIHDRVVLSAASVASDTRFSAALLGGGLEMITGSFHRVQIRGLLVAIDQRDGDEAEPSYAFARPEIGPIIFQNIRADSIDLYGAVVSGNVSIEDTVVAGEISFFKESPRAYLLHNFAADDRRCDAVPIAQSIRTTIGGDLICKRSTVTEINLINVRAAKVELSDMQVSGDIVISALPESRAALIDECFDAHFESFSVDKSKVGGDVKLDGLTLTGNLNARGAEIKGQLQLSIRDDQGQAIGLRPESQINFAELAVHHLKLGADEEASFKVTLNRARIEILEIHLPSPISIDATHATVGSWMFWDRYDSKVDESIQLRNILKVTTPFDRSLYTNAERWLRRRGDDEGADEVHVDMRWRAALPARRRDRITTARPNLLQQVGMAINPLLAYSREGRSKLIGVYTEFWTAGTRIFLAGLFTLPLSLIIAGTRENIMPSLEQLGVQSKSLTESSIPAAGQWSAHDTVQILVANHVPIVPVVENPRWELAEHRPLILRVPRLHIYLPESLQGEPLDKSLYTECVRAELARDVSLSVSAKAYTSECGRNARRGWKIASLSPAGYGLFIKLLFWIAWPLFLIGIAANMQRRREQS